MTTAATEDIILLDPASRAKAGAGAGLRSRKTKKKPPTGENIYLLLQQRRRDLCGDQDWE